MYLYVKIYPYKFKKFNMISNKDCLTYNGNY